MQETSCRVCGDWDLESLVHLPNFPFFDWPTRQRQDAIKTIDLAAHLCNKCGHVQSSLNDSETIKLIYDVDYLNLPEHSHYSSRAKLLQRKLNFRGKTILDIGGGTNPQYSYFSDSRYSVLDMIDNVELHNELMEFYQGAVEDSKIDLEKFDFIFLFHLIEHLNDPYNSLKAINERTKRDVILVIEVPNIDYYLMKMPNYLFITQHLSNFGLTQLDLLLERAGFIRFELLEKSSRLLACYRKDETSFLLRNTSNESEIEEVRSSVRNAVSKLRNLQRNLLLEFGSRNERFAFFGCGGNAVSFLYFVPDFGHRIERFYDSDPRKNHFFLPGFPDAQIENPIYPLDKSYKYFTLNSSIKRLFDGQIEIVDISKEL